MELSRQRRRRFSWSRPERLIGVAGLSRSHLLPSLLAGRISNKTVSLMSRCLLLQLLRDKETHGTLRESGDVSSRASVILHDRFRRGPTCTFLARSAGRCAQHGGAGREANLIFVLPSSVYVGPPVGGLFGIKFSSRRHPRKFGQKRFLAVKEVLAGKWGGLFLGYLLGKNFWRRVRDRRGRG